jgi:hypothetical protein
MLEDVTDEIRYGLSLPDCVGPWFHHRSANMTEPFTFRDDFLSPDEHHHTDELIAGPADVAGKIAFGLTSS